MNKLITMASVALAAMAIYSCDEDTAAIGQSLTHETDKLSVTSANFEVSTKTIVADSVYTLSNTCYFGCIKDPETGTQVKSEFSSQFRISEHEYVFPEEDIVSRVNDLPAADSCELIIFIQKPFSAKDSLNAIKMRVCELDKPMEEGQRYYSNYDPFKHDMIRKDGLQVDKMFSYANLTDPDTLRSKSTYFHNIRITLNDIYIDKAGIYYENYGTYILQQYFKHPEYFQNSYAFSHHVCPGFFFQITDGLGFHTQVYGIGLRIYYTAKIGDDIINTSMAMAGTSEVVQTTFVSNDNETIRQLADESDHTYIKSPSGLFTEVTLPITQIKYNHEGDSLLASRIVFQRINNQTTDDRVLGIPSTLLMVPKDSLHNFFEKSKVPDNKLTYVSSYTSSTNTYTFSNISNLVTNLWNTMKRETTKDPNWTNQHPNWNKVLLVPVSYTSSTSSSEITNVEHDMRLTSARLVGGPQNANQPIQINVVYGKFKD